MNKNIIQFTKQKSYEKIRQIGKGGLAKALLVVDPEINEYFVCKKYEPHYPSHKEKYYNNFKNEIKLMYRFYHKNIIRIFNYHLYPEQYTGYIVMEYVEGQELHDYIIQRPEKINDIFYQTIEAFCYLEENKILHRDIRYNNILVDNNDQVKVIDFGFGKQIFDNSDYDKSITLNWWCETPKEFNNKLYDFRTEVYFVGMLFKKIINDNNFSFDFPELLNKMTQFDEDKRVSSFAQVKYEVDSKGNDIEKLFDDYEKSVYQYFSNNLIEAIAHMKDEVRFHTDYNLMIKQLNDVYKSNILEGVVLDISPVISTFISSPCSYWSKYQMPIETLKDFIDLMLSCDDEKFAVLLLNLHNKIHTIEVKVFDNGFDDIPF